MTASPGCVTHLPSPHPSPPLLSQVSGFSDRLTWVRDPPRTTRVNREHIIESVDKSLMRLQTDHVDLLQV